MRIFGEKLELLIIDVDGVLLKCWPFLRRNLEEAAVAVGLPAERVGPYMDCINDGSGQWKPDLKNGFFAMWPEASEDDLKRFRSAFREIERKRGFVPAPGSAETVQLLHRFGLTLSLCTTNEPAALEARLKALQLRSSLFRGSTTGRSRYIKPDPRSVTSILSRLNIRAHRAAYVGDWDSDYYAARGAGVRFFGVTEAFSRQNFLQMGVAENHILNSFAELGHLIKV